MSTPKNKMQKRINSPENTGTESKKENEKQAAKEQLDNIIFIQKNTRAEGDCAFHAALGEWSGLWYSCSDLDGGRKKVANKVREVIKIGNKNDHLFVKIVGILNAVLIDPRCPSDLSNLKSVYDKNKKDQESRFRIAEANLEKALLNEPGGKLILSELENNTAKNKASGNVSNSKKTTILAHFHKVLNNDALKKMILKDKKIKDAFDDYNTATQVISIETHLLNNIEAIDEYAKYLETPSKWLLPAELELIAVVNDITIRFYQFAEGKNVFHDTFNPGCKTVVSLRHDGKQHYERMDQTTVSLNNGLEANKDPKQADEVNQNENATADEEERKAKNETFASKDKGTNQNSNGSSDVAKIEEPRGVALPSAEKLAEIRKMQEKMQESIARGELAGVRDIGSSQKDPNKNGNGIDPSEIAMKTGAGAESQKKEEYTPLPEILKYLKSTNEGSEQDDNTKQNSGIDEKTKKDALDKSSVLEDKLKSYSEDKPGVLSSLLGVSVYKKLGKRHDPDSDDDAELKDITELMESSSKDHHSNRSLQRNLPIKDDSEAGEYSGEINAEYQRDGAGVFSAKTKQGGTRFSFGLWQKDKLNGPGYVADDQGLSELYGQFRGGNFVQGFGRQKVLDNNNPEKIVTFTCRYTGELKQKLVGKILVDQYHGYGTLIYEIDMKKYRISGEWRESQLEVKDRNDIESHYNQHYENFRTALNAIDWQDVENETIQHQNLKELVTIAEMKDESERLLSYIENTKNLPGEFKGFVTRLAQMHKAYEHASKFVKMPKPKIYHEDIKDKALLALKTYTVRLTAEDSSDKDRYFTLNKVVGEKLAKFTSMGSKKIGELKQILTVKPLIIKLIRKLVGSANRDVIEIFPEDSRQKFIGNIENILKKIWDGYFLYIESPYLNAEITQDVNDFITACFELFLYQQKEKCKISKDEIEKLNISVGISNTLEFVLQNLILGQGLDEAKWNIHFNHEKMNFNLKDTTHLFVEILSKIFNDSMQTLITRAAKMEGFRESIDKISSLIIKYLEGLQGKKRNGQSINYYFMFGNIIAIINYLYQVTDEKNIIDEVEIKDQLTFFVDLINANADVSIVIKLFSDYNKSISELQKHLFDKFRMSTSNSLLTPKLINKTSAEEHLFFSKQIMEIINSVSIVFKRTFSIAGNYDEKIKLLYPLIDSINSLCKLDLTWYVKNIDILDQNAFQQIFRRCVNDNCAVIDLEKVFKIIKESASKKHFGLEVIAALYNQIANFTIPKSWKSINKDKEQLESLAQLLRSTCLAFKHFEHQTRYNNLEQFYKDIVNTFNYCLHRSETQTIFNDRMQKLDKYIYFDSSINAITVDEALRRMQEEYPENRLDDTRIQKLKEAYELYDKTLKNYFDRSVADPEKIIAEVIADTRKLAESWYFDVEKVSLFAADTILNRIDPNNSKNKTFNDTGSHLRQLRKAPKLTNQQLYSEERTKIATEILPRIVSEYLGSGSGSKTIECEIDTSVEYVDSINNKKSISYKNKIIAEILAGLAFVLSMSVSELIVYSYNGYKVKPGDDHKYLKPHCIQILGILRMLSIDSVASPDNSSNLKIENHLAQILTGQGKSWALSLLAGFYSLIRYNVVVACYSEYLSTRDMKDFNKFLKPFNFYNVQYKTFFNMCQDKLIVNGRDSIDTIIRKLVNGEKWTSSHTTSSKKPKEVLLFDEVDVFFSDKFGVTQSYVINVTNPNIAKAQEAIWKEIAANKLAYDQLKTAAMSVLDLRDDVLIRNLHVAGLLDGEIQSMIQDAIYIKQCLDEGAKNAFLKNFKLDPEGNVLKLHNGRYERGWFHRYYNSFYYLSKMYEKNGTFEASNSSDKNSRINRGDNYGYVQLPGGSISYSELPKDFVGIFGATGTLKDLYQSEREMLYSTKSQNQGYNFSEAQNTFLPSFTGKTRLNAKVEPNLSKTEDEWLKSIREIARAEILRGRSVLVFFENEELLRKFYVGHSAGMDINTRRICITPNFILDDIANTTSISSDTSSHVAPTTTYAEVDKKLGIEAAGSAGTLTLLTKEYGRGVDFKASSAVNSNNGIHVIQTFYSADIKEEIQIKGRTARNGEPGSYEQILCAEHLKKQGFGDSILNATEPPSLAFRLNQRRTQLYDTACGIKLKDIEQCKRKHDNTREFFYEAISSSETEEARVALIKKIKTVNSPT